MRTLPRFSGGLLHVLAPLELAVWALGTLMVIELAEAIVCRLSPVTCSPTLPAWMVWLAFGLSGASVLACVYRCWRAFRTDD